MSGTLESRALLVAIAGAAFWTAACTGNVKGPEASSDNVGDDGGGASGGNGFGGDTPVVAGDTKFECKADAGVITGARYRRLTSVELRNSLADLLATTFGSTANAADDLAALAPDLARVRAEVRKAMPQDPGGSYKSLDQDVQLEHVQAFVNLAEKVGARLTAKDRIGAAVGACATDADTANDVSCVTNFIRTFGARALRRPLSADDQTFYASVYGSHATIDPAALADTVAVLLSSPRFLYHVETGGAAVSERPDTFTLDGYELASRLSYHFWQSMPDDELLRAAADGSLETESGYKSQVDRVFKSSRTQQLVDAFFTDWLKLDEVKSLEGGVAFKAFAGADLPKPNLPQAMVDDALNLVRDLVFHQPDGDLKTLLTSDASFAGDPALAKLYGVPMWDGKSSPPRFPDRQRPGILTRAALLAQPIANTRPIIRGAFVRHRILCDEIPPPPANAMAEAAKIVVDPKASTRSRVEAITQIPGTACAGCHTTVINPIGFALEGFDSLGRVRTEERIFDDKGAQIATASVDTKVVASIDEAGQGNVSDAADLIGQIAASAKVPACLARQYVRFSMARWEDESADGCLLEQLRSTFAAHGDMAGALAAIALSPTFKQRTFR